MASFDTVQFVAVILHVLALSGMHNLSPAKFEYVVRKKQDGEMINLAEHDDKILVTPYSKVARMGSVDSDTNVGRSFSSGGGQILWTQRSSAAINRTQNPNSFVQKARKISTGSHFHYPTYVHQNSYSTIPEEALDDNEGEVLEDNIDRYNPRPYFGPYGPNQNNRDPPPPPGDDNMKTPSVGYDSGPPQPQSIYNSPPGDPPNEDSSISYTPPPSSEMNNDNKPPEMEAPKTEEQSYLPDSYSPPASGPVNSDLPPDFDGYYYPPLEKPSTPSTPETMKEPVKMIDEKPPQNADHFYPSMVIMDHTTQKETDDHHHNMPEPSKFPDYLIYNPHQMEDTKPAPMMPASDNHPQMKPPKLPDYLDYNPNEHQHHMHHDYPPKNSYPHFEFGPYEDHHHVYHEVEHPTTTTPKPMMDNEQRVNKKPYSYYYLGRKLWYIPLYFSLYFIIYIFALIVKSILRHKVKFPNEHDWNDFRRRTGRGYNGNEIVNTVTEHVMKGISSYGAEQFAM